MTPVFPAVTGSPDSKMAASCNGAAVLYFGMKQMTKKLDHVPPAWDNPDYCG
ncbi:hypothetical protein [Paenibacillus sanfengchensis]|uniref:hypothetical protein n=1 Tax=Paenibacillus sanfengchensis TaxID=3119819 RepID=UPI002FE21DDC